MQKICLLKKNFMFIRHTQITIDCYHISPSSEIGARPVCGHNRDLFRIHQSDQVDSVFRPGHPARRALDDDPVSCTAQLHRREAWHLSQQTVLRGLVQQDRVRCSDHYGHTVDSWE